MRRYGLPLLVALLLIVSAISAPVLSKADSGIPAWQTNTAYTVGQLVTYNGSVYKCIQAHTSQVDWTPPAVPALWQLQAGTPVPSATTAPTNTPRPTNTSVPTATKTNTPIPTTAVPPTNTAIPTTAVPPTATFTATAATSVASRTNTVAFTNTFTPTNTLTLTKTATLTPTTSGGCSAAAWNSATIYVGGSNIPAYQVSYNGHLWYAKWWTQGDVPGGSAGVWADLGPCGTQPTPTITFTPSNTFTPTPITPSVTPSPTLTSTVGPSPTICTSCGGSLPEHIVTGYWQDFTGNGAAALRLSSVPMNYTLIAVAFANATGTPGAVSFSVDPDLSNALGGYSQANFIADIQTLHSQGRKVIISVGGQNGSISVSDSSSAANFANSVYSIMTQFGFDGVDIDLENGINPTYMANALQQLSGKVGSGLIITLAPQTIDMQSTSGAYFQLALNIKSILTVVNMQYYNSGSMLGCDGQVYNEGSVDFLTALACIQLQGGLRPDQIGLGLPANSSGAGSGAVSPSVVNNALDCLEKGTNCGSFRPSKTYSGIRGAMDWDINWDANNSYQFVNTIAGHFGSLP